MLTNEAYTAMPNLRLLTKVYSICTDAVECSRHRDATNVEISEFLDPISLFANQPAKHEGVVFKKENLEQ